MNSKSKNNRTQRIRVFHGLLKEAGLIKQKYNLLEGYGVESTKDLKLEELEELISYVRSHITRKNETPTYIRKKRSVIMTLLNELGIYKNSNDWDNVNAYMMKPQIAGKLLYEMNGEDLDKLARKLRAIIKKKEAVIKVENFKALNN